MKMTHARFVSRGRYFPTVVTLSGCNDWRVIQAGWASTCSPNDVITWTDKMIAGVGNYSSCRSRAKRRRDVVVRRTLRCWWVAAGD